MHDDLSRRHVALDDDLRLSYIQAGEGRDVVLIHGVITTALEMVISLFDALAPHVRVTAFDRPGHGESTRKRFDASPQAQAALLMEGCRRLGLSDPILVGHSLGATVAVQAALMEPDDVAGVVAIAPLAFPEPRLEQVLFGARAIPGFGDAASLIDNAGLDVSVLPALWRAMFLPQEMPDPFRDRFPFDEVKTGKSMLATGEDAMAGAASLAWSVVQYPRCQVPITVMAGDRDLVVSPHLHAQALAAQLPQGRLVWAPGRGHMLHHFEQDLVRDAVSALAEADRPRKHRLSEAAFSSENS